ncbi:hypothetical protein IFM89_003372 [Coptis chinensis]|uniref:Uncharacterized protein n=1 Tax=Coptis chinensis TaxID=261450 RepID=A0A835IWK7_9MAGN|nr:hypothetical protein IFM89_003372 [Coptis chinensis]
MNNVQCQVEQSEYQVSLAQGGQEIMYPNMEEQCFSMVSQNSVSTSRKICLSFSMNKRTIFLCYFLLGKVTLHEEIKLHNGLFVVRAWSPW